ncbi:MAG: hypothetical protein JWO97_4595 [Acidobacteria bacterium]|nr:hypothetical protein [Acidobacteriota bacterium]
MSLPGFDTLLQKRPADRVVLEALETAVEVTLRHDPNAILDEVLLANGIHADLRLTKLLLIELAYTDAVEFMFFWLCPNGYGTAAEERDVEAFPDEIDCERCGESHRFRQRDIEAHFLPTNSLRAALLGRPSR